MNKLLAVFFTAFILSVGLVHAQEEGNTEVVTNAEETPAAIEVGNTVCPLSGATLNLEDPTAYTKLEAEGFSFNVAPASKTQYDTDPSQFADQIAQAVAAAQVNQPAAEEPEE